ncbi:MAG: YdaU family protein [Alphaproteobacteria bacterium]
MSKQSDTWMPVYPGDYYRDTQRLTTEQHGAYLLLLLDYWTNGPPPLDDAVLCSITRLPTTRFRKHKLTLLSFFQVVNGKLRHKRVDAEKVKAEQITSERSKAGKAGAEARWHGSKAIAIAKVLPSDSMANGQQTDAPSPSFPNGKGAFAPDDAGSFVFKEGLALLVRCGSSPTSARSFLGKCRKAVGDEKLAGLIQEAERKSISDPKSWLSAACAKPSEQAGLSAAVIDLQRRKAAQEAA